MNQTLFDHLEAVRRGAKTTVRQKRTPSAYQRTILDDVTQGVRAITVEAGPGSGKTALLEMIAALILELSLLPQGEKAAFLAFNKDIVGTLKKVIPPEFDVRTVSSLGHLICTQNLSGLKFEPRKYDDLIREIVCEARVASPPPGENSPSGWAPVSNCMWGTRWDWTPGWKTGPRRWTSWTPRSSARRRRCIP